MNYWSTDGAFASAPGGKILLAMDSASNAQELIQRTRRLAGSLNIPWIVLYVEPRSAPDAEESGRLKRALDMARDLGADVITTMDENMAAAVLRVASQHNVSEIVIGRKTKRPWWKRFGRDATVGRLIAQSGEIAVQVIPVQGAKPARPKLLRHRLAGSGWLQYAVVVGTVVAVAVAGFLFTPQVGAHAMAFLSLLAVVVLALFVERGPALLAAALTATIWDYFFLPPVFAFRVSHFEDALLLGMFFVVALVLGQLTTRIRAQEAVERKRENRATALYLLTRELAQAATVGEIVQRVVREMERAFDAQVVVLLPDESSHLQPQPASSFTLAEQEQQAAAWVLEHRKQAGRFTDTMPSVETLFVPLAGGGGSLGVLGLRWGQSMAPTLHQQNLLEALCEQIALVLDRHRLSGVSEKAKLLAESERLSKTLLDSMSHEIRTPLAAIKSAVAQLNPAGAFDRAMITEIQEATERLNRLVGKVLDITRLESGHVRAVLNECDVSEVVNLAVAETEKDLARHHLTVQIAHGLPIVEMDFVFVQQALMNLLSNAAHHTPPGTPVELRVWVEERVLTLAVADRGPGLDPQSLRRVFEKFYRGPSAPTGGVGLGLSLVKGLMEALGGRVKAENRPGGGTVFTLSLPVSDETPGPADFHMP
jgi:two-component system, OmpR family, sensor histidine kinase KdpD